jgi:hypothetical protein
MKLDAFYEKVTCILDAEIRKQLNLGEKILLAWTTDDNLCCLANLSGVPGCELRVYPSRAAYDEVAEIKAHPDVTVHEISHGFILEVRTVDRRQQLLEEIKRCVDDDDDDDGDILTRIRTAFRRFQA